MHSRAITSFSASASSSSCLRCKQLLQSFTRVVIMLPLFTMLFTFVFIVVDGFFFVFGRRFSLMVSFICRLLFRSGSWLRVHIYVTCIETLHWGIFRFSIVEPAWVSTTTYTCHSIHIPVIHSYFLFCFCLQHAQNFLMRVFVFLLFQFSFIFSTFTFVSFGGFFRWEIHMRYATLGAFCLTEVWTCRWCSSLA